MKNGNRFAEAREEEVVKLAQNGDQEAFEFLYKNHRRKIFCLCLKMTQNYEDAEDATQNTFLRVSQKLYTFGGKSAFHTWLFRVATNEVRMLKRKKGVVALSIENLPVIPDLDRLLESMPVRILIKEEVEKLSPGYKRTITERLINGRTNKELAELHGCTVGNVKSTYSRGLTRLLINIAARHGIKRNLDLSKPEKVKMVLRPLLADKLLN